jgi:hypothetical protein
VAPMRLLLCLAFLLAVFGYGARSSRAGTLYPMRAGELEHAGNTKRLLGAARYEINHAHARHLAAATIACQTTCH